MSDPFKMEEEKPVQETSSVLIGVDLPKVSKLADQMADQAFAEAIQNLEPGIFPKGLGTLKRVPLPPLSEELGLKTPKIHHSTLKKRDKTTINCRLKRENAEWLRSVAPKGPGGALEIGSVLDGLVDRARKSGGAS